MTALMAALFGRMPIGWLQLTHNRTRMAAALAGVAFANVLVFVQLGLLGALNGSIGTSYQLINADIMISSQDANTLTDGSPIARRLLFQALGVDGVLDAVPLYLARLDWTRPDGVTASLQAYALPPEASAFAGARIRDQMTSLSLPERALLDVKTRGVSAEIIAGLSPETPFKFESNGKTVSVIGSFYLGGSFNSDGNIVVSDQTFLRLFGQRLSGTPSQILVKVEPGRDAAEVSGRLASALAGEPVLVRPMTVAIAQDLKYQTTKRPTGVIFGFGVFIGILVGLVIVYQVLATDVADHLREYATFKAMGYGHRFFLGIVFEEALVLAVFGFLPGIVLSMGFYAVMAKATGLPIQMEASRAAIVFFGTIIACTVSGAIATRRLAGADPADLF
ncbi:MAG: ABC transporter permease DevC [Paracoccaceae bacterium]